jgi:hypothetical protein
MCKTRLNRSFLTREDGQLSSHIMLRDLLRQKSVQKILVTDFGYPRACRFRKHQILNRSPELPLPTFLKKRDFYFINVAKIGKNGQKMEIFDFFEISHFFNAIILKLF